jgi:hypothetical protein
MTDADRGVFGEGMFVLGETFNEPVSEIRAEAYFDALKDFTLVQATTAIRLAMRSLRFFPKPVELREMVEGTPDGNADTAWAAVLEQIRRVGYLGWPTFQDERVPETIRQLWGSWSRLCETLPADGPELVGWLKQFKAVYRTVDMRQAHARLESGAPPRVLQLVKDIAAAGRPRPLSAVRCRRARAFTVPTLSRGA